MSLIDEIDSVRAHPVTAETQERARQEVARRATSARDGALLLAMLGLDGAPSKPARDNNRGWPSDLATPPPLDWCAQCGAEMTTNPGKGQVRRGSRELCELCHTRAKRAAAAKAPTATDQAAALRPRSIEWQDRAACRGLDPEQWFPVSLNDTATEARETCHRCPVRGDCRDDAIARGITYGIRAGYRLDVREEFLAMRGAKVLRRQVDPCCVCTECGREFSDRAKRRRCQPCQRGLVAPDEALEHIETLLSLGASQRQIALSAGIEPGTVCRIVNREVTHIMRETSARITAVTASCTAVPA
ncbi:WhiB family transcriptional regulator [Nocardia xishanensis]